MQGSQGKWGMERRNGVSSLKKKSYKMCHDNYAHVCNRLLGGGGIGANSWAKKWKQGFTVLGARKAGMPNKVVSPRNEPLCCQRMSQINFSLMRVCAWHVYLKHSAELNTRRRTNESQGGGEGCSVSLMLKSIACGGGVRTFQSFNYTHSS